MQYTFRTDASHQIGTGHVMRCLTLAHALRERGAECRFICREHRGNLLERIREQGFAAVALPTETTEGEHPNPAAASALAHAEWLGTDWRSDAEATQKALGDTISDWLIVDHYALDHHWESALRPHCRKILVIDDLADRNHDCDLLLDQNLVADQERRYNGKLPDHCARLLGPQYALLQPQYAELHPRTPPREGPIRRILVYFGGADRDNLTGLVLSAFLSMQRKDITLDVVINSDAPHADAIREQVQGVQQVMLHTHRPSLAPLMVQADLAIGAAGTTSWERCSLGLPSLVITLAENQRPIAAELERQGVIRWLGHKDEVNNESLVDALADLTRHGLAPEWSARCQQWIDGKGTERVCLLLQLNQNTPLRARLARLDDEALILRWANDPLVRKNAFTAEKIDPDTHRAWFYKRLRDLENCRLYIVETEAGLLVGQVRFERSRGAWEVHYAMDVRCRGRGIGVSMLNTAVKTFRCLYPLETLFGRVKPENSASCKIFTSLGFVKETKPHELIFWYGSRVSGAIDFH